jgi:Flp pilus assembly protein TadG
MELLSMFRLATNGTRPTPRKRRDPRSRRGAVILELAILMPVLSVMALGMFELSRAVMVKQTLTAAARKGARTGILTIYGNTDITNDATNIMRDAGFDTTRFNPPSVGAITITVTDPSGNTLTDALDAPSGSVVSVQVGIPVSSFAWVTPLFMGGSTIESDVMVMMKQ